MPLLLSPATQSATELSQSSAFRRKLATLYDALRHGKLNREVIRKTWRDSKPNEAIRIGAIQGHQEEAGGTIFRRPR